jgi:autotransporter-associated beta strand protein
MKIANCSLRFSSHSSILSQFIKMVAVCVALFSVAAHGKTLTWSGYSGGYWNNTNSWFEAGVPANGDTIVFSGSATNNMVNTNDIANLTLNQIRFINAIEPGGMFDLRGNAFTVTSGIMVTNTAVIENKITLATANVTVDVAAGVNLTLAGQIAGSVGVTKIGPGTLTYSGSAANTYSGLTAVNEGELDLNKPAYVQAIAAYGLGLVIGDGTGTDRVRCLNNGQIWSIVTPVTINSSGVLDLNGNMDEVAPLSLNGGYITSGSTGQLWLYGTVKVLPAATATIVGNVTLDYGLVITNYTGADLDISASISGAYGITAAGAGNVYLLSSNSYTGLTVVQPGEKLWVQNAWALGGTSGTVVSNGATLVLAVPGNSGITNKSLTLNGPGVSSEWGALDVELGTNTWAGPITNNANSTLDSYYAGSALHIAGPISGAGGLELFGSGTHYFEGSTANTYAGTTTVDEDTTLLLGKPSNTKAVPGPLVIDSGATVRLLNSFQIYSASASVTMFDSSLLDLAGNDAWVGPISLQGAQITSGTGTLYFSGNITVNATTVAQSVISGNASIWNGTYTITNSGYNYSPDLLISANIFSGGSGDGGLIKAGAGEVGLAGDNSFTGPVTVIGGCLWADTSTALGNTNTPVTVNSGGRLLLYGTGLDFGLKPLVLSGNGGDFYGALECIGSSSWEGNVTLATDSQIYLNTVTTLNLAGAISGGGGLTQAGEGTLTLSGSTANTYNGLTTVNSSTPAYRSTLVLNKSLATAAVPGNLVINNSSTVRLANSLQTVNTADVFVNGGGLFDFSIYYSYVDTLRGAGTVNFGAGGWIEVGLNNGSSAFNGVMSGTGYTFGGYTIAKRGSGTFTMNGNNTFTAGAAHVYTGKLIVNGSQPQVPAIVESGSTLGGSGTIGTLAANGIISPGNSTGILNSSNVNFSSSGNYTVELTGPNPGVGGYDQLNVAGTVSLGNATLNVIPNFTTPVPIGQQFVIITNDLGDAITGTFNGRPNGSLFSVGGYTFRINYNGGSGNDVVLTLWGVPGNTVTVNSVDQGWYNSAGMNNPGSLFYGAGEDPTSSDTYIYRNWFVFNVPVFSGSIIHAELLINCYSNASPHGQETYLVRKVSTSIATLEAGGSGLVGIYNDLGTGAVYSVRSIATNESYQKAIIPLNVTFMNDATAASGSQMALGGSIATLDAINNHNQTLFDYSGFAPDDVQLRLTFGTSMVINATNSGWYDNTGYHYGGNHNYFVGDHSGYLYRNFFVFNLPALSSQLAEAELLVNSYNNFSPSGVETYQLHDVTNSITVLTNDASGATSTYADLGSGTVYGGRKVYVTESGTILGIPLNGSFLAVALTNSSGRIALGGVLTSLNPAPTEEGFFSGSTGLPADAQLWLGFLAVPASNPSFVGTPIYLGTNQFQFTVSGTAGTTNEIQGSFDFQNWDFIRDLVMIRPTASFRYTNNTVVPYRFLRAEQLQ